MKILIVNDVNDWAIGALSKIIQKHNLHLNIRLIAIHPKDLRNNTKFWCDFFENEVKNFNPDLVHFQYWGTALTLSRLPIMEGKKKILTHHNQKNLLDSDWSNLDKIVCHTQKASKILSDNGYDVSLIQHGIDIEKFRYNENYKGGNVLGYVGRIVPWKGLYEIAKCAKEMGTKVICMGRIDKADYWKKLQEYKDVLDLRFGTPAEDQVKVYQEMDIYVGNSCDGVEEGTLGFLEAMACGTPVVTTPSGEAMDIIRDGENGVLIDFENYESLKAGIRKMMNANKDKIRQNAWDTVRHMSEQKMARLYEKLYYKVVYEKDLVSVIIPTHNRADKITQILDGYSSQDYQPIEIIVVDDNSTDNTKQVIFDWAIKNKRLPIKYFNTNKDGYNLAMARNIGIFNSSGYYIVFSDDRFVPEKEAVSNLIKTLSSNKEKCVVFGEKGGNKKTFVENFCAFRKKHIVSAGMFCERIDEYGGQSQELRERLASQEFKTIYEPTARVNPIINTHSRSKKRYELFRSKLKLWKLNS